MPLDVKDITWDKEPVAPSPQAANASGITWDEPGVAVAPPPPPEPAPVPDITWFDEGMEAPPAPAAPGPVTYEKRISHPTTGRAPEYVPDPHGLLPPDTSREQEIFGRELPKPKEYKNFGHVIGGAIQGGVEGALAIGTGVPAFIGSTLGTGMGILTTLAKEGKIDAQTLADAKDAQEHVMESLTYEPSSPEGQLAAEMLALPFTVATEGTYLGALELGATEEQARGAQFLLDVALVAAPKLPRAVKGVKKAGVRAIEGRQPVVRGEMALKRPIEAEIKPAVPTEVVRQPISPEIRPEIPVKRAEGVTIPQRKTTPEKLAEAVGKPNQVEVLKNSGVTGKKAQITEIVNDSIKSKLDAADVFERRGYIKEATRLREEARQAGETLKDADGYLTEKAVDRALEQPPEAGVSQALGERAAHLKEKKTVKLTEKAEKIEAQVPDKTVDPHLAFLEDTYSVPTERGGKVFREVDRQGGTPEVFGYGTDSITHAWTKKTDYTKAQINTAIKSVLGKSKRKPTELQETIVKDIMEASKEDFDLYSKKEGLEVQEARAARTKPTQPDMIGAREGLEGRVPAEQAPIEAGGLFDVEGRKQTKAKAEGARMQESLPGAPGDVPAGGMAYGAKLPKYAGGNLAINLERVGGDYSVKKLINDTAGERKTLINEARRGEIKHEATREMADNLGMTYESLLKRRKGQAFNAEEALAARDVLTTSAARVNELRKKAVKTNSDAALASFRLALDRHALIQAEVSGIATEAGRALQAHRIQSMQKGAEASGNYKAMLEALGGREMNEIILDRIKNIDPENQVAVNIFIRDVTKATTPDKIYEAWINALLSSPTTHVVNITSNTLTALTAIPESFTGAAIDFARAKATGTPRERYFGESAHKVYGVWDGLKEGVRKGIWSFVNEMPTEGISKLEVGRVKAIKGKKGEVARLPGRFLITADEFFKAVNYTTEVRALAYRQAVKEGMSGKARSKRIAEIIQNPSKELKQAATKEMLYRVFQQDLGPGAKKISGLRRHWGLRYIAPFIRTPVNIAKFGLERTPLNYGRILHKALKGELKKGELSTELGRATVGSMIGAAVFMHALEGNITGRGPDSKAERQALMRSGWQPYSVKVGDTYYSYGRLEPLGMVLGLHADASEIWEEMKEDEREDVATLIVKAITQNLTSKTWLRGVGDLMNAMTDPTRYAETWTQRVAGTVVPSGVAAVARGMDPTLRRAETILEKVRSRIPGHSKKGLPRLDLWGEPIRYGGGPMAQVFSPIYVSKKSASAIDHEMVRLEMTVGMPSKKIKGVKLTPAEHNEYIRLAGTMAKERLDKLVASKKYKTMPDELKAKVIKTIITGTRKRAAADVFRKTIQEKR